MPFTFSLLGDKPGIPGSKFGNRNRNLSAFFHLVAGEKLRELIGYSNISWILPLEHFLDPSAVSIGCDYDRKADLSHDSTAVV